VRLGVYADLVYRHEGATISTDRSFVNFVTALPPRVDEVVLFGRLAPRSGRDPYVLSVDHVRFVALPYYPSVFHVPELVRSLPAARRAFAAELDRLDAVWLFGPAPTASVFASVARSRGTPVLLGVRQDYPLYVRNRLPGQAWFWAAGIAQLLDLHFRYLARSCPTVTVGEELAGRYRGGSAGVLPIGLSLVRDEDVVPLEECLARRWDGDLRVLSVGRLDPEKNPLLLLDVIERLRRRDPRWRLAVVGDGPTAGQMAQTVRTRGLADAVELLGEVANGPALWRQYRSSNVFLHVSLTEGLPQVLFEAEAAGLPIVATDVGGVSAALGRGTRGLVVPPRDAAAAAQALARLAVDEKLRRQLIAAGHEHIRTATMDAQLDRVAAFFRKELGL
jgi:glycosyltransferase involved in cell wall biosynthesis